MWIRMCIPPPMYGIPRHQIRTVTDSVVTFKISQCPTAHSMHTHPHPHGMYIRVWSLLYHPVQKGEGVQLLHNFMEDPVHITQFIYVVNVWNHTWYQCDLFTLWLIYTSAGHNGSINTYAVYLFAKKKTRGMYLHLTGQTLKNKLHIRTQ